MENTAAEDKQVPNGVMESQSGPTIEKCPHGIQQAPKNKADKRAGGCVAQNLVDGDHAKPAHGDIYREEKSFEATDPAPGTNNAHNRKAPDEA